MGIMADWLFCFFVGPIGSSIAVPFILGVAVLSFLFRRNISALLTSGVIVICCVLSLKCTALIMSYWHYDYLETVEMVLLYWYKMFAHFINK